MEKCNNEKKSVDDVSNDGISKEKNELRLMKCILDEIIKTRKFRFLKSPLTSSNATINTIGLSAIGEKYDSYANLDDFMTDINQLIRSYSVKHGKNVDVKRACDALSEQCHRNVDSIKMCADCFEFWITDRENYFSRVCNKPHLLLYSKLNDYPFWPAKLMSIDENIANVEFFGDHTQADVPLKDCFVYSDDFYTSSQKKKIPDMDLRASFAELDDHIGNIKEKFGSFVPAEYKTKLDANNMQQHVMNMFPGAFLDSSTKVDKIKIKPNVDADTSSESVFEDDETVDDDKSQSDNDDIHSDDFDTVKHPNDFDKTNMDATQEDTMIDDEKAENNRKRGKDENTDESMEPEQKKVRIADESLNKQDENQVQEIGSTLQGDIVKKYYIAQYDDIVYEGDENEDAGDNHKTDASVQEHDDNVHDNHRQAEDTVQESNINEKNTDIPMPSQENHKSEVNNKNDTAVVTNEMDSASKDTTEKPKEMQNLIKAELENMKNTMNMFEAAKLKTQKELTKLKDRKTLIKERVTLLKIELNKYTDGIADLKQKIFLLANEPVCNGCGESMRGIYYCSTQCDDSSK